MLQTGFTSLYFWSLSERSTKCNIFVLGVGRYCDICAVQRQHGRPRLRPASFVVRAVCVAGDRTAVRLDDGFERTQTDKRCIF
jgi:hypothetical protein